MHVEGGCFFCNAVNSLYSGHPWDLLGWPHFSGVMKHALGPSIVA